MKYLLILICMLMAAPALAADTGLTFHGFPCTDDCSGHRAGYDWAAEHGITEEADCGGNSNSFIEGCIAWARRQSDNDPAIEEDLTYDASFDPETY